MRITIVALGTRGDVQPMIALGRALQASGHSVCLIAGANFAHWVNAYGLRFAPSIDVESLMRSPDGLAWIENSDNQLAQLRAMKRLLDQHDEAMLAPLLKQAPETDVFISGFVSQPFVQAASERYRKPHLNAFLQPYRPTRCGAATLNPLVPRRYSIVNLWMGMLAERLMWWVAADAANHLRQDLGLPRHTAASFARVSRATPTLFGFSRHVVPRPADWDGSAAVTGYWFLDERDRWQPPPELVAFLEDGPAPVYVGFGSMPHRDPQATVNLIARALDRCGQRGLISTGWSGGADIHTPDSLFALPGAPHEWAFERVSAVVHHGGAGTTATGLRAGRPTLIIPHLADQPYWGRRIFELGVGARPIPRHRLTEERLAEGIQQLLDRTRIEAACELGEKLRAEDSLPASVAWIEQHATTVSG